MTTVQQRIAPVSGIETILLPESGIQHSQFAGAQLAPDLRPLELHPPHDVPEQRSGLHDESTMRMLLSTRIDMQDGQVVTLHQVHAGTGHKSEAPVSDVSKWVSQSGAAPIPDSFRYSESLLDDVLGSLRGNYPLVALAVEIDCEGKRYISLAGNTLLGRLSLAWKSVSGMPTDKATQLSHSMRLAGFNTMGPVSHESVIAGHALMRRAGILLGRAR